MNSQPQEPALLPLAHNLVDSASASPPTLSFRPSLKERDDAKTVLRATSGLLTLTVESWIAKAEVSFVDYVTAMLRGGYWPDPLTAPSEVEENVSGAASDLAENLLDLTSACEYGTHGGMLVCAVLSMHLSRAGLADIVELRGRTIACNRDSGASKHADNGYRVVAIEETVRGVVADLGLDVALDWLDVARRVLRDAILRSVTSCKDATGVRWFRFATCHGPLQLPICVDLPEPAVAELPMPRRRRRA